MGGPLISCTAFWSSLKLNGQNTVFNGNFKPLQFALGVINTTQIFLIYALWGSLGNTLSIALLVSQSTSLPPNYCIKQYNGTMEIVSKWYYIHCVKNIRKYIKLTNMP